MSDRNLERLVERAQNDPKFFHALVFDTEQLLPDLDFLDRQAKGALLGINPREFIGRLLERLADCGVTVNCGSTCTHTVSQPEKPGIAEIGRQRG